MEDKKIICKDCGQTFIFTVKDQNFYKANNFDDPKRCRACRDARKNK